MRTSTFLVVAIAVGAAVFGASLLVENDYFFFAGYVVLQYIVLATAWNILGGYCGYVNFGTAAFFALGAYSSVAIHKVKTIELCLLDYCTPSIQFPGLLKTIPLLILIGGAVSGVVGLGMGYLTLRLRGAFFSIATLALAVVIQTLITNWDYVGGSRGAYVVRPAEGPLFGSYIQYLFLIMLVLAVLVVVAARMIERSRLGYGFATIRDDELAAEASGVPTLRLKLIATTVSGAFMGMAGAPLPYYVGYLDPASGFSLAYAVNSIAMPVIGGTNTWIGPLIGAILLGTFQQIATVTISSAVNLLIVGMLLVDFVIIAPSGLVGLVQNWRLGSDNAAQRTVFGLLYALNVMPIIFLAQQGRSAWPLALLFWAILALLALMRGRLIGRSWLAVIPAVAALSSISFDLGFAPLIAINVICLACGVLFLPRPSVSTT